MLNLQMDDDWTLSYIIEMAFADNYIYMIGSSQWILMSFDRKTIKDAGHPDTVIVALTNAAEYTEVKKSV